jgi:hypothetical protein
MSATDNAREKIQIIDWIIRQENTSNLKAISELIQRIEKESAESVRIVGYKAKGVPVTMSQLILNVKDSLDEIARGESITLENLENDSDQW